MEFSKFPPIFAISPWAFSKSPPDRGYLVCILFTNTAPTGDETLTPDDAVKVLEEILEAQSHSYVLGVKLNLPLNVLDTIHSTTNPLPHDRLLQVLLEFTKQIEPRPTWRAIVAALRNPAVNLHQLAMTVEAAHFPDSTTSHDAPTDSPTETGKCTIAITTACLSHNINGMYFLKITTIYKCSCHSPVTISEATFVPPASSSETSSTQTSGELN